VFTEHDPVYTLGVRPGAEKTPEPGVESRPRPGRQGSGSQLRVIV